MTGGVLSTTIMVCVQLLEFPQSSVARHVLVIVYACGHPVATVTSVDVMATTKSQLSVAVAVPLDPPGAVLAEH